MMVSKSCSVSCVLILLFALCQQARASHGDPKLGLCSKNAGEGESCAGGLGKCERPGNSPPHSNARLHCISTECHTEDLPMISNGSFVPLPEGNMAELVCESGFYEFSGPCYVECDGGTWTNTTAFCARIVASMARGKSVWQSSDYNANSSPENAVDGFTDSRFNVSPFCTHTTREYRPYWIVDLEHVFTITSVVVYNRQDCCATRLREVHVLVSPLNDLTNHNLDGELCDYQAGPFANRVVTFNCNANVQGRYLKIILDATEPLQLCEVEVFVE